MRVQKVEPLVHNALVANAETRADDFKLIHEVFKNFIDDQMTLSAVLSSHIELGLPSFASIIRIRRKLQQRHPELQPADKVIEIRQDEEAQYLSYVRG